MSWRETTIWTWTCDLCEQELPCGCDDGECRVGR